jgi:hypothetical protein
MEQEVLTFWKTYHHRTGVTDGAGSAYTDERLITTGHVLLMEQEVIILLEDLSPHL